MKNKKITVIPSGLAEVEKLCVSLSSKRAELASVLNKVAEEKAAIDAKYRSPIRSISSAAAAIKAMLHTALLRVPSLFESPRTRTFSGIKVGYRKGSGKLDWDDDDKLVALIRKHLPEKAGLLIRTKEVPFAEGLERLDAKELAKLGVSVEATGDQVVITLSDPSIDKQVKQLIDDKTVNSEAA